jgi:hypothetical protein
MIEYQRLIEAGALSTGNGILSPAIAFYFESFLNSYDPHASQASGLSREQAISARF